MELDVKRMRLLREVAERGTITAAADAMAYTPSAVSQQLAALEKSVGMALLERQGRNVVLTEAGRVLVSHTEEVLASLERATIALARTGTEVAGKVRMGVIASAVIPMAMPVLEAMSQRHPLVDVFVVQSDDVVEFRDLRLGELDLSLGQQYSYAPIDLRNDIELHELLTERMFLVVPEPSCPDDGGLPDLGSLPWIVGADQACARATLGYCRMTGFEPEVRYRIDDFTSMLRIVAAGLGATVVPHLALIDPPPGVRTIPLDKSQWNRVLFAATRPGSAGQPAVSAIVETMRIQASRLELELDEAASQRVSVA